MPLRFFCRSDSLADTRRIGASIAGCLRPGAVCCFEGELGAGKTTLIRAIAEALGVDSRTVSSPTFAIVQSYRGSCLVRHVDAYRLKDSEEAIEAGIEFAIDDDAITLIEWPSRISDLLPDDCLWFSISATAESSRRLECLAGDGAAEISACLRRAFSCESGGDPN